MKNLNQILMHHWGRVTQRKALLLSSAAMLSLLLSGCSDSDDEAAVSETLQFVPQNPSAKDAYQTLSVVYASLDGDTLFQQTFTLQYIGTSNVINSSSGISSSDSAAVKLVYTSATNPNYVLVVSDFKQGSQELGNGDMLMKVGEITTDGSKLIIPQADGPDVAYTVKDGWFGEDKFAEVVACLVDDPAQLPAGCDDGSLNIIAPDVPVITTTTASTNDNTPTIEGTAEAGSTVELFNGSDSLGTVSLLIMTPSLSHPLFL